jgi:hypothetical protein
MLVFPTPSAGEFRMLLKDESFIGGTLSIFDQQYRLLTIRNIHSKEIVFKGDLPDGPYMLVLEKSGKKTVRRMVVKN